MTMTALDYFNADLTREFAHATARIEYLERENEVLAVVREENEMLRKVASRHESDAAYYRHRWELLTAKLFGKSSEKHAHDPAVQEALLPGFGDEDRAKPKEEYRKVKEHTRKVRAPEGTRDARSSRFPAHLPRQVTVLSPESTECACCGKPLRRASTPEVTEKLCCHRNPFYVEEHHRYLYACDSCETVAPKPLVPQVFERSLFHHSTASFLLVNKFRFGLPIFRQHGMWRDLGIKVSSDSMLRVTRDALSLLSPIHGAVCKSVGRGGVTLANDSRLEAATGKIKEKLPSYKRGALWGLYGMFKEVAYTFSPSRTHEACREVLKGVSGYLVVDAYDGFEQKVLEAQGITLVHCNNHARRKFVEAELSDKVRAREALAFYQALYIIEEECKDLPVDERKDYRQKHAVPVLETFRSWLDTVSLSVMPKTPLAKAVRYVLTRWESLTRYLEDARIPFDTMDLERTYRTVAVSRKNFLHCSSELGAHHAAVAFTLIQSCVLQDIDPFIYLCDVLERVGSHTNVDDLIPRVWKEKFYDEAKKKYSYSPFDST